MQLAEPLQKKVAVGGNFTLLLSSSAHNTIKRRMNMAE
jgi:hypothetical protein